MLGIVILAIVLLTIVLETGLSFIEERVHHSHNEVRKVLLEKFFKEFTMLGLIAFTLLFLEDRSLAFFSRVSDAVSYDYHRMHLLFEFGHFLILFMALAFMIICLTLDTFVKVIERRWKRLTDRSADVHLKEWLHHLATLANANASGVFGSMHSMPVLTTTEPSAASPAAALGSHALDRKLERLSKST